MECKVTSKHLPESYASVNIGQGTCYTVDVQKIIQEPLVRAGKQADKSEEFWENFVNKGYEYAIKKQYGIFYEIKYFIKKAINRN